MLTLDHVLLAATGPKQAHAVLDSLGWAPSHGGELSGTGLANLVVPVGVEFLEVLYPTHAAPVRSSLRSAVVAAAATAPGSLVPVGWMARTEDVAALDEVAVRVGLTVTRHTTDWPRPVAYRLVGLGATLQHPWRPVLIAWETPPNGRPGTLPAAHRTAPTGITSLHVTGDADDLRSYLGESLDPRVRVSPGTRGPVRVEVATADEHIVELPVRTRAE